MKKVEKIENFLKEWENKNSSTEDSYIRYKEWINPDGNIEELDLFDELENLLTNLSIKYNYINIGSFESPGYDATYDCLSVIDEEGNIRSFPIITEIY